MKFSIGKLLPLLGIAAGIFLGMYTPLQIPKDYTVIVAIILLAAFDSVLGALKSYVARDFKLGVFLGGLVFNMIVAAFLGVSWESPQFVHLFGGHFCFMYTDV